MSATPTSVRPEAPSTGDVRRYAVHGIELQVETDVPAAAAAIADSYGVFAVDAAGGTTARHLALHRAGDRFRLTGPDGAQRLASGEQAAVVGLFDLVVDSILAGLAERGLLGIHAGAVEIGGRAVVLSGESGRGKSTLTLGLLRHGGALLSDEMAVVGRDDATLLPFPRSIHVRPETLDLFPELTFVERRPRYDLGGGAEWCVRARDLTTAFGAGLAAATPIAGVVLLDGRPDPARPARLEPVAPAVAAMELMRGTPAAARDFGGTLRRLSAVAAQARCARLQMGELDLAARTLVDWLGVAA